MIVHLPTSLAGAGSVAIAKHNYERSFILPALRATPFICKPPRWSRSCLRPPHSLNSPASTTFSTSIIHTAEVPAY